MCLFCLLRHAHIFLLLLCYSVGQTPFRFEYLFCPVAVNCFLYLIFTNSSISFFFPFCLLCTFTTMLAVYAYLSILTIARTVLRLELKCEFSLSLSLLY